MHSFVSERNYAMHREWAEREALRLSVLLKDVGEVGAPYARVKLLCRRGKIGAEAPELYASVALHRTFFDSFSPYCNLPSAYARSRFGSEAALINSLYTMALGQRCGFVALVKTKEGARAVGSERCSDILESGEPLLAIDVCEHAYYGDYGFGREEYVRRALMHLDLARLECAFQK